MDNKSAAFNMSVHGKHKVYCGGCKEEVDIKGRAQDLLKRHVTDVHKISVASVKYFYCPFCFANTSNFYAFVLHILQDDHRAKFRANNQEETSSEEFMRSLGLRKVTPGGDTTAQESEESAAKIKLTCHSNELLECAKCEIVLPNAKFVYEHVSQWHETEECVYRCALCDETKTEVSDFQSHLLSLPHKISAREEYIARHEESTDRDVQSVTPHILSAIHSTNGGPSLELEPEAMQANVTDGREMPPLVDNKEEVQSMIKQSQGGPDKRKLYQVLLGNDQRLHCGHCNFSHTTETTMRKHICTEHQEKLSFTFCICEPCSQVYNSYWPFKYHVLHNHNIRETDEASAPAPSLKIDVTNNGLVRCCECRFTSEEAKHVRNHAQYAHQVRQVFMQFECMPCRVMTRQYNNFVSHLTCAKHLKTIERLSAHDATMSADEDGIPSLGEMPEDNTDANQQDLFKFAKMYDWNQKVEAPRPTVVNFVCRECTTETSFTSMEDLLKHKMIIHPAMGSTYRCRTCGVEMSSCTSFVDHIQNVHGRMKLVARGNKTAVPFSLNEANSANDHTATKVESDEDSCVSIVPQFGKAPSADPVLVSLLEATPESEDKTKTGQIASAPEVSENREADQPPAGSSSTHATEEKEPPEKKKKETAPESSSTPAITNEGESSAKKENALIKDPLETAETDKRSPEEGTPIADGLEDRIPLSDALQEILPLADALEKGVEEGTPVEQQERAQCRCNICKIDCSSTAEFEKHLSENHPGIQALVSCLCCKLRFKTKKSLLKHLGSSEHINKSSSAKVCKQQVLSLIQRIDK